MASQQTLAKHKHSGNLVSSRNKSGESGCSAAASALARRQVTHDTASVLAKCRGAARHYKRADALKNAGKHKEAKAAIEQGHAARASLREQLGAIGKALPAKGKGAAKPAGAKSKASPAVAEALGHEAKTPKGKPSKAVAEAMGKPKGKPETVGEALGRTNVDTVRRTKEAKQDAKPKNQPLGSKSTDAEKEAAAKPKSEGGEAPSSRYPEAGKEAGKNAPRTIDAHSKEGKDARAKMLEMFSPKGPKQQHMDFEGKGKTESKPAPDAEKPKPTGLDAKPAGENHRQWWNRSTPAERKAAIQAAADHHGKFEKPRQRNEFGGDPMIGPRLHHTAKTNAHERDFEHVGMDHLGSVKEAHKFAKKSGGNAGGSEGKGASSPIASKSEGMKDHASRAAFHEGMAHHPETSPSARNVHQSLADEFHAKAKSEASAKPSGPSKPEAKPDFASEREDRKADNAWAKAQSRFGEPIESKPSVKPAGPSTHQVESKGISPAVVKAMGHSTSAGREEQPHEWWNRITPDQRLHALNGALQHHTHAALTGKQKIGASKIAIQGLKSNIAGKVHEQSYHKAGAMSLPAIHEAHKHAKALGGLALYKLAGKDEPRV